nr:hypothetical protein [Tanacetum cinerariifolium]
MNPYKWPPALTNSHPLGKMLRKILNIIRIIILKDLDKHLLIEERYRLENKTNDDTSKVYVMKEKGESFKAGGKKRRHDDKDKRKSQKNKKDVICYNFKKPGHFKRECRALKKKQDGGKDNKNKDNNFVAMISEAFSLKEEKSW